MRIYPYGNGGRSWIISIPNSRPAAIGDGTNGAMQHVAKNTQQNTIVDMHMCDVHNGYASCMSHDGKRQTVNEMEKRTNGRNGRTARTVTARTVTTPTVTTATTIDAMIVLARTVTVANYVAIIAAVRAAFPVARESRNMGRTTNRRVQSFQSWTMVENASWKLNDVQIAFLWIAEFPAAIGRVFTADPATNVAIVRGVRRDYNRGRHCPAFATNGIGVAPAVVSESYNGDVKRFDFAPVTSSAPAIPAPVAAPVAPVAAPARIARNAKRTPVAPVAPVAPRGRLVKSRNA